MANNFTVKLAIDEYRQRYGISKEEWGDDELTQQIYNQHYANSDVTYDQFRKAFNPGFWDDPLDYGKKVADKASEIPYKATYGAHALAEKVPTEVGKEMAHGILGAGEALTQIGTGIASTIGGGVAAIPATVAGGPEAGREVLGAVQQAYTFEPKSWWGEVWSQMAQDAWHWLVKGSGEANELGGSTTTFGVLNPILKAMKEAGIIDETEYNDRIREITEDFNENAALRRTVGEAIPDFLGLLYPTLKTGRYAIEKRIERGERRKLDEAAEQQRQTLEAERQGRAAREEANKPMEFVPEEATRYGVIKTGGLGGPLEWKAPKTGERPLSAFHDVKTFKHQAPLEALEPTSPYRPRHSDFFDSPEPIESVMKPTVIEVLTRDEMKKAVDEMAAIESKQKAIYAELKELRDPRESSLLGQIIRKRTKKSELAQDLTRKTAESLDAEIAELNKKWWDAQKVVERHNKEAAEAAIREHNRIWADPKSPYRGMVKLPKKMGGHIHPDLLGGSVVDLIRKIGQIDVLDKFSRMFKSGKLMGALKASSLDQGGLIFANPKWFAKAALPTHSELTSSKYSVLLKEHKKFIKDVIEKEGLEDVPFLVLDRGVSYSPTGEMIVQIIGHNGRHRMQVFGDLQLDAAPVALEIPKNTMAAINAARLKGTPIKALSQDGTTLLDFPEMVKTDPKLLDILEFEKGTETYPSRTIRTVKNQGGYEPSSREIIHLPGKQRGAVSPEFAKDIFGASLWKRFEKALKREERKRRHIPEAKHGLLYDEKTAMELITSNAEKVSDWGKTLTKEQMSTDIPRSVISRTMLNASFLQHITKNPLVGKMFDLTNQIIREGQYKAHLAKFGSARVTGIKSIHDPASPRGKWDALSQFDKQSLVDIANRFSTYRELTRSEIIDMGYSTPVAEAYAAFRKALQGVIKDFKEAGIDWPEKAGYFPKVREGDFKLDIIDLETKEKIYSDLFNSTWARARAAKDIQDKLSDKKIQVEMSEVDQAVGGNPYNRAGEVVVTFELLKDLVGKDDPRIPLIESIVNDVKGKKGFGVHRAHRTNVRGGELTAENFVRGIEQYIDGAYRYLSNYRLRQVANEVRMSPDITARNFKDWAQEYVSRVSGMGDPGNFVKFLQSLVEMPFRAFGRGPTQAAKTIAGLNTLFMIKALFFWRPAFLGAQIAQPWNFAPQWMALYQARGVKGSATQGILGGAKTLVDYYTGKDMEFVRFVDDYARARGSVDPRMISEASRIPFKSHDLATAVEHGMGISLAQGIESFGRVNALAQGWNFFKSAGYKGKDLYRATERFATDVMVDYASHERPAWVSQWGVIGQLAGPLSTFATNYSATTLLMIKEAIKNPASVSGYKPLALHMGTTALFAGVTGMVGAKVVDQIIRALNYLFKTEIPTLTEYVLTNPDPSTMADVAAFGVLGGTTGLNFSASMAAPEIQGVTLNTFPALNLLYEVITGINDVIVSSHAGNVDFTQLVKTLTPTLLRRIGEVIEADVVSANAGSDWPVMLSGPRRQGGAPNEPEDRLARYLGTTTVREVREREILRAMKETEEVKNTYKRAIIDAIVRAHLYGEYEMIPQLVKNAAEAGMTYDEINEQTQGMLAKSRMTRSQQYFGGTTGFPSSMKGMEKYLKLSRSIPERFLMGGF